MRIRACKVSLSFVLKHICLPGSRNFCCRIFKIVEAPAVLFQRRTVALVRLALVKITGTRNGNRSIIILRPGFCVSVIVELVLRRCNRAAAT